MNKYNLKQYVHYNPYNGVFTRIQAAGSGKSGLGAIPESYYKKGIMKLFGEWVCLAKIAALYQTGKWPEGRVRFLDNDETNYKWDNLEVLSPSSDGCISWIEKRQVWQAYINHDGKAHYVGCSKDRSALESKVEKKRQELGLDAD